MSEVLDFIQRRFPTAKDDPQWVSGNCYYFALILQLRFPLGHIVYDTINGHFMFVYHSLLVDAVHHEYLKHRFNPTETNYYLTPNIISWEFFELYDSKQYKRIIRDCVE